MRVLQQFKGRLTPTQAANGINAAVVNAKRLAEDAQLLLEAGRYPSASSFAILALEELGKRSILRELLTANSDVAVENCWRRYRKHTEKTYLALLPDRIRAGATRLHEFSDFFLQNGEIERATFDAIKQLGFYTDCCANAHWSVPSEVVGEQLTGMLVSLASTLSENREPVTVQELELWQSHMAAGLTCGNLLKWCAAMVSAGLKPPDYLDEMKNFTRGEKEPIDDLYEPGIV